MYDLTQQLVSGIPRFPGDPQVRIEPLPDQSPWQVSAVALGTHSGTHVDAPRHRIPGGAGIGAFGPERLIGAGFVIDAGGLDDNQAILASVLDGVVGHIAPGWFALLRTGWDRHWGDARYFRHPFLSPELAARFVQLRAGIVAIDALNVDSTVDGTSAAHVTLLGAGILIAENLCRLDALDVGQAYQVAILPLPLGDADGAPARVVAWESGKTFA